MDAGVRVRSVEPADQDAWVRMRHALWPEGSAEEHRVEVQAFLRGHGPEVETLVAEREGTLLGFVELSIRAYAEGCRTDRVAYLEGWYVEPSAREQGIGRGLVSAAEAWARARGCTELASDTESDNTQSAAAHRALGFSDVGLIRCFRKDL
jgi:aminoglycoside 6'-N-acetyltransferase I